MPDSEGSDRLTQVRTRAEVVRDDVYALLEVDVTYPDWERRTADKKAFYVRGFTWFRDRVLARHLNVTDCGGYVPVMKALLAQRPEWRRTSFPWDERFSPRQFVDSASDVRRLSPKFHKAAEIILLCEVIATDLHRKYSTNPPPETVYDYMRIEPAVSFVHGLNRDVVQGLSPEQGKALRQWTGQPSMTVFFDMADGATVTHKLAVRTLRYFERRVPKIVLGEVDYKFWPNRNYNPSKNESFDVKDEDLPAEARPIPAPPVAPAS